jgi:hypothetical protein
VQERENKFYAKCENLIPYTQYNANVFDKGLNGKTNPSLPSSVNFTTLSDGECQKVKWRIISNFVGVMMNFLSLWLRFEAVYIYNPTIMQAVT